MSGTPVGVSVGRLVGGDLDGARVDIETGQETVEGFGMGIVLSGSSPSERAERLARSSWLYRYVRVEETADGREAIFEFDERAAGE